MINETIFYIKQNNKLYNYLKYHSYWYYVLTYDSSKIKEMIKEMKIEYKETSEDKIIDLQNKIETIRTFLEVLN